jgi:hypothetical protein
MVSSADYVLVCKKAYTDTIQMEATEEKYRKKTNLT